MTPTQSDEQRAQELEQKLLHCESIEPHNFGLVSTREEIDLARAEQEEGL
jgi:hypothetical protein